MKSNNNKRRVIISSLIIFIVISSFSIPVLANNNLIPEGVSKLTDSLLYPDDLSQKMERQEETPPTLTLNITTPPDQEDPIDAIKAKAVENRKHRLHQLDQFNYNQKDVEELLLSGATLEDIYRSDQIGNQLLVNPKELIKNKHEGKQTWDEIETEITVQKEKQLKTLKKKHANLQSKLSAKTISIAEELEILQHIESNPDQADDVIAAFQTEGRSGLQKLQGKNANVKGGE